jgi:hypothetical protein
MSKEALGKGFKDIKVSGSGDKLLKTQVKEFKEFHKGNLHITASKVLQDEYVIEIVDKEQQSVVFANEEDLIDLYNYLHELLC